MAPFYFSRFLSLFDTPTNAVPSYSEQRRPWYQDRLRAEYRQLSFRWVEECHSNRGG
jgi:hypothetical protein